MSEPRPTSSTPPISTPSPVVATGSSSPGSASGAQVNRKATKQRRSTIGGMACVVAVIILLWTAALTIPMPNGSFYGGASEASVVVLVYIALIAAKRHGYETPIIRELEKREGERDRATSQRAWVLTDVVGLVGSAIVGTVEALGRPMVPALAIVLRLQLASVVGGSIYFNHTM